MPSHTRTDDLGPSRVAGRVAGRSPSRSVGVWAALFTTATAAFFGCGFKPAALPPPPTGTGGTTPTIDGGSGGTSGAAGSQVRTGPTSLTLSPASATMTVANGAPAQTQQYMVSGIVNGQTQDLTSQASYTVSPPGVITIDNTGLATSTGTAGGKVTVTANVGSATASATLIVNYTFTGADPGMTGIPTGASSIFTTTTNDTTRSPQLVYPNDGVLFPPNITGIEIHFQPGSTSNTLFEVSLKGPISTVNAFVRCAAPAGITGCIYLPDPSLWAAVAVGNAGQGRGVAGRARHRRHRLFRRRQQLVQHPVLEGQHRRRALLLDHQRVERDHALGLLRQHAGGAGLPDPGQYRRHLVRRLPRAGPRRQQDGGQRGGQGDGRLLLWDIANNKALQTYPLSQRSQFESWNSDGTQFVGMYGDKQGNNYAQKGPVNLNIFDGMTGMVASTIDLGGLRGDHPDWSKSTDAPNTIVFTSADATAATSDQHPATGGIDYVQYDGTAWGAPMPLVPSMLGKNRYYPAIAPDGDLVVYDESTCTKGTPTAGVAPDVSCDADTDPTATMFLTSISSGGSAPIALTNANSPGVADGATTALTNSFPKWSPFIEKLTEQQQLVWLTFSSTRQYGLRAPPASTANSNETKLGTLIWMVGISPGVGGADPSYTAFALPFQDITTSNHIAQWAKFFLKGPG